MSKPPKTYSSEIDRAGIDSMHPDAFRIVEQASGWVVFFDSASSVEWDAMMAPRKRA